VSGYADTVRGTFARSGRVRGAVEVGDHRRQRIARRGGVGAEALARFARRGRRVEADQRRVRELRRLRVLAHVVGLPEHQQRVGGGVGLGVVDEEPAQADSAARMLSCWR
jgi:hypothetical protein